MVGCAPVDSIPRVIPVMSRDGKNSAPYMPSDRDFGETLLQLGRKQSL